MEEKVIKVETNDGAKFEVPFNVLYNIKGYEWDSDPSFIDLDSTTFTRVLHFLETYQGEVIISSISNYHYPIIGFYLRCSLQFILSTFYYLN